MGNFFALRWPPMTPEERRQTLQQWHGVPQPAVDARLSPLRKLLETLLPKLGLSERLSENQILAAWQEIVGEFLATHSRPASLKGGLLIVQVLQPSVRYELERNWKAIILQKLQLRFGKNSVKEIRFR